MPDARVSATAALVAQSAVFLSRHPTLGPQLPPGAADLAARFLAAAAPARLAATRWLARPALRWLVLAIERVVLPGIQLHYALRKRFIEEAVRAFVGRGGRRLVVLGAGFDTLAVRLARACGELRCVEVDRPATQEAKRRALAGEAPPNLSFVAADLAAVRPSEALAAAGQCPDREPCFVVLEGVTMYLEERAVSRTLADCAGCGGGGTQVAWTFMTPDARGRLRFRGSRASLVDAWLARRGEPFTWGLPPEHAAAFLAPLDLRLLELASAVTLRERFLAPAGLAAPLAEGEAICLCEVAA